jgi:hypothetical protein
MDEEQIIGYEVANLAEEKGYPFTYVRTLEELVPTNLPTQSVLQKWLRDIHDIHIEPQYSRTEDYMSIEWWSYVYNKFSKNGGRNKLFPSEYGEGLGFEKALEIGLREGLRLVSIESKSRQENKNLGQSTII